MNRRILASSLLLATLAPAAHAGVYVSPTVRWASFSARPEASEPTPNYYGFGGALGLGYSFAQIFDMGLYGSYTPARLETAKLGEDDATLIFYGGELAVRIAESIYFGVHGGASRYALNETRREGELKGKWSGPAGGVSLGAVHRLTRQSFLQTSLDVMHTVMQTEDAESEASGGESAKRRFDSFGVSLSYVWNGDTAERFRNTILGDFIDALSFF